MTERLTLQVALAKQMSFRVISLLLKRAPSTVSREMRRHAWAHQYYQLNKEQDNGQHCCRLCLLRRKLLPHFELVTHMPNKKYLFPEQVAGQLKNYGYSFAM